MRKSHDTVDPSHAAPATHASYFMVNMSTSSQILPAVEKVKSKLLLQVAYFALAGSIYDNTMPASSERVGGVKRCGARSDRQAKKPTRVAPET